MMVRILVVVALLLAASAVQAGGDSLAGRATSVAEMLQNKQEHRLRDELAAQGRWDEIRKLDEEKDRQLQERQQRTYAKINEQLARSGNPDTPIGEGVINMCGPVRAPATRPAQVRGAGVDSMIP